MTIKRITFLQELLAYVGLKDRLHLAWISSAEAGKFVDVVNGFTEQVRNWDQTAERLRPEPLAGPAESARTEKWRETRHATGIRAGTI